MSEKPKQRVYSSVIDNFLDERTPDYKELGLTDAKKSGNEWLERTHGEADLDFLDDIAGDSHHTNLPGGDSHAASDKNVRDRDLARQRQKDKEAATARLGSVREDWNNRAAKVMESDDAIGDVLMTLEKATGEGTIEKKEISDGEIQRLIKHLLNEGASPHAVQARLNKLAEINVFNTQMGTEYLQQNAGLVGLAYLEPNTYMDKCPSTYERMKVKAADGKIRAKSVKQIAACEGCSYFKQASGSKTCGLYGLPIVSNRQELMGVVNKLTAGVPAKSKKAALVQIANRTTEHVQEAKTSSMISRVTENVVERSLEQVRASQKSTSITFEPNDIQKLHLAGQSLEAIYKQGTAKVGSAKAAKAVREFVASLKKNKTKIALSQIDCTFLKNKLSIHNAVVGAAKCGSCTYRQGMHCGLTGGTLVSFPGMEKQATNHKVAADAPKDGHALLQEYDLSAPVEPEAIDMNGPEELDVEMDSSFKLEL